jgi:hypothetical protein
VLCIKCCLDEGERGLLFIGGGGEIFHGLFPSWMPHESSKPTIRYTEPSHPPCTDVEQVDMCHQAKVGLEGSHQGRARALGGPPWVQFRWAASCYLLDLAHGRYPWSWVGLVSVWASTSLVWPWILLWLGLFLFPLNGSMFTLSRLRILTLFLCISDMCPANTQLTKTHRIR